MSKPAENKHEKQRVLWTLPFKKVFEVNVKYKACTQQIVSTRMYGFFFVCVWECIYHSSLTVNAHPLFSLFSSLPNSVFTFTFIALLGMKEEFPLSQDSKAIQEAIPDSSRSLVFEPAQYLNSLQFQLPTDLSVFCVRL